ncbi:MAG TPA: hypothetical protein VNU97_19715 [Rhizomicrobium sp.]|jgi:hypothetical protein|nr:hypothetical protein [Rhizomicrobium sp.]
MSEAAIAPLPKISTLPFEQQLYLRSPFGLVPTTLLVFILEFGSFLVIAAVEHIAIFRDNYAFSGAAWPAVVLSLLCCAALAMQRYARVAEAGEASAYAKILTGGMASALGVTAIAPSEARFLRATLIGAAIGGVISIAIRMSEIREGHPIPPLAMAWYAAVTIFMVVLFARGVEQTRAGDRGYGRTLDAELKIDLLRIDMLAVLGRSAARSSLIWFVISAIACLFFVGGDLNWLTSLLIASCAAMGIGLFVSTMSRIHKQIVAAKAAELEHIRCQIDTMRTRMVEDDHAGARLSGMLAYEKRISEAPEWPFDQTTAVRVAASAFIVTVPWFGQAIAAYVVDHLSHIGG